MTTPFVWKHCIKTLLQTKTGAGISHEMPALLLTIVLTMKIYNSGKNTYYQTTFFLAKAYRQRCRYGCLPVGYLLKSNLSLNGRPSSPRLILTVGAIA